MEVYTVVLKVRRPEGLARGPEESHEDAVRREVEYAIFAGYQESVVPDAVGIEVVSVERA
jgi:hypothetical protein